MWKGTLKNGQLDGTIFCYYRGQLLLEADYVNNMKHGRFKEYRNGILNECGFYIDGYRAGIVSNQFLMDQKQYQNGKLVYQQVEEHGYHYIVNANGEEVQELSAYRITSDNNGVFWFQPEGYSLQCKNGFNCLKYISYPDPESKDITVEVNDRMFDTKESMTVLSTVDGMDECLYMGRYYDSFTNGYSKDGPGIEFFQDFTSNSRINLNATFHNNRVVSKGQFVRYDSQICVCNAEWDQDGLQSIVLFDEDGNVKYHGKYYDWEAPLRVKRLDDLSICLPYYVSSIYISNVSSKLPVVDFSRFILARLIMIGKQCFLDAKKLICFHMPNLKCLIIGSGCFNKYVTTNNDIYRLPAYKNDHICTIAYCDSLEVVRIGVNCFSAFSSLVLKSKISVGFYKHRQSSLEGIIYWKNHRFL